VGWLQLWVLAAKLEVRCKRVDAARRILGMAIGMAPKVGVAHHAAGPAGDV
jgi:hypothetical protein